MYNISMQLVNNPLEQTSSTHPFANICVCQSVGQSCVNMYILFKSTTTVLNNSKNANILNPLK